MSDITTDVKKLDAREMSDEELQHRLNIALGYEFIYTKDGNLGGALYHRRVSNKYAEEMERRALG